MTPNPYVGPRAIGGGEHKGEKIYGRDREIADLMDLVITERVVLLYSPSGAGKTSLLQAGLVPAMEKRRFQVRPPMRVNAPPPREVNFDPANGNRFVLSCLLSLEEPLAPARKKPAVELSRMSLLDYLGEETRGELLIFDQFEEILTVDPMDRGEKLEFFGQLGDALQVKGRWAVFAMREDYLAGMDAYTNLVPTHFSNTFRLDLLKPEAASEAIRRPAKAEGVDFAEDAAAELVKNLQQVNVHNDDGSVTTRPGLYVEPVQLQVVCYRRWQQLKEGSTEIRKADLAAVGSVDAALAGYYADSVTQAVQKTGVSERDLRDWFGQCLITKQNTRGQVVQGSDETARIQAALKPLVDSYLVRSDKRLGAVWYELAHDRLIAPVRADNRAWRKDNLSVLQKQTELWAAENYNKERLLSGGELEGAKAWAQANPLRPEEKEFLEASEAEELRLQELEKSALERRRGKRLWWMAVGASALTALSAFGVYTYREQNKDLVKAREEALAEIRELRIRGAQIASNAIVQVNTYKSKSQAEADAEKNRIIAEARLERDEMRMTVLRETSIESMLDPKAAGGEVKPLSAAWAVLASGPEKRPFAIARELGGDRGRLIGVGHDGFLNYVNSAGSSLFLKTALQWLKQDRPGPIVLVRGGNVNDGRDLTRRLNGWKMPAEEARPIDRIPAARLKDISVLVVTHGLQLSAGDAQAVRAFVDGGGGLLVTGYGWVYAKYGVNNGRDIFGPAAEKILDGYPINILMKQFDARWTNEVARDPLQ